MKKEEKINYKIDSDVLKNYVEAIASGWIRSGIETAEKAME